jgi:hypothetical protein
MNLRAPGWHLAGANLPPQFVWSRQGWANANAAMNQIFEILPDKYPILLRENGENWTFGLSWPRHLLEHVDLALPERAQSCYGLELAQLADYLEVRRCGRVDFVFSMFHSRALVAAALATARRGGQPLRCVMHVDAHHDLGTPFLKAIGPATLANVYFKKECHLNEPDSVTRFIDYGFIHKGSFLTAFCLGTTPGHLYHISQGASPRRFWLYPATDSVLIGNVLVHCDYLNFFNTPASIAWEISESPTLPQNVPLGATDGIWLDVDLDAFCNRFDGDSDRRGQSASGREVQAMRRGIATFLENLSTASWLSHVEAVSVAASPGFFPSEFWEFAIPTVCDGITNALCL